MFLLGKLSQSRGRAELPVMTGGVVNKVHELVWTIWNQPQDLLPRLALFLQAAMYLLIEMLLGNTDSLIAR